MLSSRFLRCALAPLIALAACGDNVVNRDPERLALLTSWTEDILFPHYEDASAKVTALENTLANLCAGPDEDTLADARHIWSSARAPWKEMEVFHFGPYREEPLRFGPKIDGWPARPATIDDTLVSDAELTAELLGSYGIYSRGFPALEVLLYPQAASVEETLASFDARRCEYLRAASARLRLDIDALEDSWVPSGGNFVGEMLEPGVASNRYDDLVGSMSEVVNRMGFLLENMQRDKVLRPSQSSDPAVSESFLSQRSVQDLRDNVHGIELLFFGDESAPEAPTLETFLLADGVDLGETMRGHLASVAAALDAIDQPMAAAILNDPSAMAAAADALREMQVFIQLEVIPAARLRVEFNDADGD